MKRTPNDTASRLFELRAEFKNGFPTTHLVTDFVETSFGTLFPHFCGASVSTPADLQPLVESTARALHAVCAPVVPDLAQRNPIVDDFLAHLPAFHSTLKEDAVAIYNGDPAAHSIDEVILSYPGFFAIAVYRLAHWLRLRGVPLVPRLMTELAHARTGIDIHPGATIGRSFVIDHGTGIVIGETTHILDNVKLYQGVTLGALSVDKALSNTKRHPTIESNVVIYANATILGGDTTIGSGSVIGGNVWLTTSVPAGSRVYHRAEVTVKSTEY